jgi:hypothetical protein
MQVVATRHEDAIAFADRVRPFLMERECENCLMLGLLGTLARAGPPSPGPLPLLLRIESQGRVVVGAAVQTRPIALAVTRLPDGAAEVLVNHVETSNWPGQGFTGPVETVDAMADLWARRSGKTKRLHVSLRVFELTAVTPPAPAPGRMIPASIEHLDAITPWHEDFVRSVGECDDNPRQAAQRLIDERRLFLWEDDAALRSMAAVAGPTPNGIRINHVYTPPEHRARGYASNLVAALSQHMLDQSRKFCFLFADLANPTSNKIYQQIGFRPAADFRHWTFEHA